MTIPFILLLYVLSINNFFIPTWVWVVMWLLYGANVIKKLGDIITGREDN